MAQVKVNRAAFEADVKNGLTKSAISEKYGVSPAYISLWVKQLGLKLKREVKPKYVLSDDVTEMVTDSSPDVPTTNDLVGATSPTPSNDSPISEAAY